MMKKQPNEYDDYINDVLRRGIHTEIPFPDGSIIKTDLEYLFSIADGMAAHYGIGRCKTFTEFVKMVDEEDPVIVAGLLNAANIRIKAMYGLDQDENTEGNPDRYLSRA